jgi:hypothetical protein
MANISKKQKTVLTFIIALLMTSMVITMPTPKVKAQQGEVVYPPGTVIQNPRDPAGISPMPAGVKPDVSYDTAAYLAFEPNPVGLGQPFQVNMWMQPPIDVIRYFGKAFLVTLTKPDGSKDVIGPLDSYFGDSSAYFTYTPDQLGTWQVKLDFLGTYYPAGNYTGYTSFGIATQYGMYMNWTLGATRSVYYKPSSDGPFNFTVQSNIALSWPSAQLPGPGDYWTRPVTQLNREWWPILGNYPGTGIVAKPNDPYWPANTNTYAQSLYKFTPYVTAPNTCHIVWTKQTTLGGMIGGTLGQYGLTSYAEAPSIVYNGRCYATYPKPGSGPTAVTYWECYDLRTGQQYWERPLATGETAPTEIAYITRTWAAVAGDTAEMGGLNAYLLAVANGRLITYNPLTGAAVWNVSIAPLTTGTHYANSELAPCFYSIQTLGSGASTQYRLINWTLTADMAFGGSVNFRQLIVSNVTWPFSSLGYVDFKSGIAVNTYNGDTNSTGVAMNMYICAARISDGQLLWNISTTMAGLGGNLGQRIADDGKFCTRLYDGKMHAWDLQTGREVWVADISSWPWGVWSAYSVSSYGGMLIQPQYDGLVAYNWTNGNIVWHFHYPVQYPYDNNFGSEYPFFGGIQIADRKIYVQNNEHSPTQPPQRGYSFFCIDVNTGEGIWNISGTGGMSGGPVAVADGYLVAGNGYDGQLYNFGIGKSATTVTTPQTAVPKGQDVLIQGAVLDESPAQPGTPCVSADSMKTQMEYLHEQQSINGIAGNATMTGVPVVLTATDSTNNNYNIGTATTNAYDGTFGISWTPPSAGIYHITATFAGDNSYGSSFGGTQLLVNSESEATTSTPAPTNTGIGLASSSDIIAYIIGGVIATIFAITIVSALILRNLRRK